MSFHGPTNSFRLESLLAIHDFSVDVFNLALYTAPLDETTAAYNITNEAAGAGYVAGGQVINVSAGFPQIIANRGVVRFDNVSWPGAAISAQYGLIYNTSKANRAVYVLYFGQEFTSGGVQFDVNFTPGHNPIQI